MQSRLFQNHDDAQIVIDWLTTNISENIVIHVNEDTLYELLIEYDNLSDCILCDQEHDHLYVSINT